MAANTDGSLFAAQWRNPAGVLSLLMIIGGPVIQSALAQLTGPMFVPVCFSFGWVSYAFSTIPALVGDGRLMPPADYACKVINLESGYARTNKSWIIGRLLRDLEKPLSNEAMYLAVYRGGRRQDAGGKSKRLGILAIIFQLGIAAIPAGLYRDWGILMIVAAGTCVSLMTAALPQWRMEKTACRTNSKKPVAITTGNGSRHIVVVVGNGECIDLEDLATAEGPRQRRPWINYGLFTTKGGLENEVKLWRDLPVDLWLTRLFCTIFILLWAGILISVLALKENAWFLVGSGTVGMIQNAIVAAASRGPGTRVIHLSDEKIFTGSKVMDVLMDLDDEYEGYGRALLKEFFAAGLDHPKDRGETEWWEKRAEKAKREKGNLTERGKGKEAEKPEENEIMTAKEEEEEEEEENEDGGGSSRVGAGLTGYNLDRYQDKYAGVRYDEPPIPRGTTPSRGKKPGAIARSTLPAGSSAAPNGTASNDFNASGRADDAV